MTIEILEMLPRDGLQALLKRPEQTPSTEQKLELIRRLVSAGIRHIEVTSFSHPKWLPQLADAEDVVRGLDKVPGVHYQALVPNVRGAQRALAVGVEHMACLISASETYQRKNSNMSIAEGLRQIGEIKRLADAAGVYASVSMGNCFWCPYEGRISEQSIREIVDQFVPLGIGQVTVSDSIGCADPEQVSRLVRLLKDDYPHLRIGVHLHDFTGMALTNLYAAWKAGAEIFDGSLGGIGGGIRMPIDVRRMGNIATEDVVHLFGRCGVDTGVDLKRLQQVSVWACELLHQKSNSRLATGGTLRDFLELGRAHLEQERSRA